MDEDNGTVKLISKEKNLTLYTSQEEDALGVTLGYVLYEAAFTVDTAELPLYVRRDGVLTQDNLDEHTDELKAFMNHAGIKDVLYWSALEQYPEDPVQDVIGRIFANRITACVISNIDELDKLLYPSVGDCILLYTEEDPGLLLIQSKDHTYVFYHGGHWEAAL